MTTMYSPAQYRKLKAERDELLKIVTGIREALGSLHPTTAEQPEEFALVDADLLRSGWEVKAIAEGVHFYHLPPNTDWMPHDEAQRTEWRRRMDEAALPGATTEART
jgi:hypothetical protein